MEDVLAKEKILIVDDEKNIVTSLQEILSDEGYEVATAEDGLEALELIQADPPDLILLDIWIPGMDGIEVLKAVKTYHPEIEVLVMSGHGTIDTAVQATKLGAQDFIEKPFSLDELVESVGKALKIRKSRLTQSNGHTLQKQTLPYCFKLMVEVSQAIKNASKHNLPALIVGESGTGKEIIAKAVHHQSKKAKLPFVKLNCAVRPARKIQEELFSAPRANAKNQGDTSAKTNPGKDRVVYLKNIDSLSKSLQEKLAQALQPGTSKKSDRSPSLIPARVFASTSANLEALVEKGQFNNNLYEILRQEILDVPPLRENAAIIPNLVQNYFEELALKTDAACHVMTEEAMEILCEYSWPDNLKELRSVLDQSTRKVPPEIKITPNHLPSSLQRNKHAMNANEFDQIDSMVEAESSWEKEFIIHHLNKNNWDIEKTSEALKTDKKRFQGKLEKHGIRLSASADASGKPRHQLQRTLKRSVVLCGSGLHSGFKTGLIMQPLPPGSGVIFGDISSGANIPARLENVQSTDYSTCLKKGFKTVDTIEHIMAVLHMYRISNLLIKIGDEAPVMDGSSIDFCRLIEDAEFEEQDEILDEVIIDRTYRFENEKNPSCYITIEPADRLKVSYHMDYPAPIGIMDHTFEFDGEESFKREIAPARTFGFVEEITQLTKMGFGAGGKLDNFILLGDDKVLNTELRFKDEFARHKILDILGDFYLLGKPIRGHIKAHKTGHTQNIGLLRQIETSLCQPAGVH